MKDRVKAEVSAVMDELKEIRNYLYKNPELGNEEYKASAVLSESLSRHGFKVDKGIYGIETAFRGTYDSGRKGPRIVFLCEYDALPGVGHGCGHNLIATIGLGAGIGLKSVLDEIGGSVVILGTPAEETKGAKVAMAKQGEFQDVFAAMMVHPNPVTEESGSSLALSSFRFEFFGKSAHAAQAPELGVNALDGIILLFNGINALRQQVTSDVRIHGIITNGGLAANIIPEYASAEFYIRAATVERMEDVIKKVHSVAKGAAQMTGARVEISVLDEPYDNMKTNQVLSKTFNQNLLDLGEAKINPGSSAVGSIDMGNVSQVVPAIHGWLGFGDEKLALHTKDFAEATITEKGDQILYRGACAMAMTAYDLIVSQSLQDQIRQEFERRR